MGFAAMIRSLMKRKNEAVLYYKGERFFVWEDDKSNWHFTYLNLDSVNTGHRELQLALNVIYESIDDKLRKYPKKRKEQPNSTKERTFNLADL